MDTSLTLTIAIGVIIGATLLFIDIAIIRSKGRSSKLAVDINAAVIRATGPGSFDYRIDLDLRAKADVGIDSIELEHGTAVIDPDKGVNRFAVDRLADRPSHNPVNADSTNKDVFQEALAWQEKSFPAAGEKLAAGTHRHATGAGSVETAEFMGGHWNWPLEGWTMIMKTSAGEIRIPLVFTIHASNREDAFCQDYGNPTSLIWSC